MPDILALAVVGLIVGIVARLLMPGSGGLGIFGTIVVGAIGAVLGGYFWREVFGNTKGVEWVGAILTAMVLLWVYRRMALSRAR